MAVSSGERLRSDEEIPSSSLGVESSRKTKLLGRGLWLVGKLTIFGIRAFRRSAGFQ